MLDDYHLSLDIETLAKGADAVVVSIGACVFHPRSGRKVFSSPILLDGSVQLSMGRKIDADTVNWWMTQSEEAKAVSFGPGERLRPVEAIQEIHELWLAYDCSHAWGYGAVFDLGILESLGISCNHPMPWTHRNQRCLRTLAALFPEVTRPHPAVAHNPAHDSWAQAEWAIQLIRRALL